MAYSKKELRQAYIARLQQLDLNTRLYEERKLASLLYDQPEWTGAKTIAVTGNTLVGDPACHARHKGQQIVVPRTLPHRQMEFVELNEDTDFDETSFGILEPHDGKVYSPDEIDLMVVPGVAFTASGNRLGFGGGYYDRYLKNYKGPKVSMALTTQLAEENEWEPEEFDQRIDKVLYLPGI